VQPRQGRHPGSREETSLAIAGLYNEDEKVEKEQSNAPRYDQASFEAAAKPLIQWLNETPITHRSSLIAPVQWLYREIAVNTKEFLKD
jgi:hypothetical protein